MGLELRGPAQPGEKPPLTTDQQGMLSGEEKARELAIMQSTIRLVGPDKPEAGGGLLNLVKKTLRCITDQHGMLSREEKARELAVMQNKNTIRLVGLDGPGVGRACSTS